MIEDCEVHTKEWLAEMKMIDRPMLQAVGDVMAQGRKKHAPYSWAMEPENEHLFKAVRHLQTYLLQRDGYHMPDGEDHLKLALTRVALALAKRSTYPAEAHMPTTVTPAPDLHNPSPPFAGGQ